MQTPEGGSVGSSSGHSISSSICCEGGQISAVALIITFGIFICHCSGVGFIPSHLAFLFKIIYFFFKSQWPFQAPCRAPTGKAFYTHTQLMKAIHYCFWLYKPEFQSCPPWDSHNRKNPPTLKWGGGTIEHPYQLQWESRLRDAIISGKSREGFNMTQTACFSMKSLQRLMDIYQNIICECCYYAI